MLVGVLIKGTALFGEVGVIISLEMGHMFDSEIPQVDIYLLRIAISVGRASVLECPGGRP